MVLEPFDMERTILRLFDMERIILCVAAKKRCMYINVFMRAIHEFQVFIGKCREIEMHA